MCKMYVTSEIMLGNRSLGYSLYEEGHGVKEMTENQLIKALKDGKEIYSLKVNEKGNGLELDEEFFATDIMEYSHIDNFQRKFGDSTMANVLYTVLGSHEENGKILYDVVSNRYEVNSFGEEKIKVLFEIEAIGAGAKLSEEGKIILAPKKIKAEPVKVEPEQKSETNEPDKKEQDLKKEEFKTDQKTETPKTKEDIKEVPKVPVAGSNNKEVKKPVKK